MNYKFNDTLDLYANISQNYRSINFTDMQIQNSNFRIDPNLQDETGFNADVGARGVIFKKVNYDVSLFALFYNNRIGEIDTVNQSTFITYRYRTNVASALTKGVEAYGETDVWKLFFPDTPKISLRVFANFAINDARYVNSSNSAINNKKVEFVPPYTLKTGLTFSYKNASISYQYAYVQEHFSDATNAGKDINDNVVFIPNAVVGVIPSYSVMDLSLIHI